MNGHKLTGLANGTASGDAINFGQFVISAMASGFITFPGGIIVQWGNDGSTNATQAVTLPLTFPNNFWAVVPAMNATAAGYCAANIDSTSQFTIYKSTTNFAQWIAIGN